MTMNFDLTWRHVFGGRYERVTTRFWWEITVQLERDMSQAISSAESVENSKSDTQSVNDEIPTESKGKST